MTGVGDGCDSCLAPRVLWTDEDAIEVGFPKDRTFQSVRDTFDGLPKDKEGAIMKKTDDYESRQGICREPVTLRETLSFSMTHKVAFANA